MLIVRGIYAYDGWHAEQMGHIQGAQVHDTTVVTEIVKKGDKMKKSAKATSRQGATERKDPIHSHAPSTCWRFERSHTVLLGNRRFCIRPGLYRLSALHLVPYTMFALASFDSRR